MKLKVKKPGAACVALAMVVGLSACASSGSSADSGGNSEVTLDWSLWDQGDAGNKIWHGLADDVHTKYPNITVKLTAPPFADYFTKLQTFFGEHGSAWNLVLAASVISIAPTLILVIALQKHLVKGIATVGLAGR